MTDTNRSALAARARWMRSRSVRNWSRSRVSTARMPGSALMRRASARAIASTTSFSRTPAWPVAPGSSPPWPASTAITTIAPGIRRRMRGWRGPGGGIQMDHQSWRVPEGAVPRHMQCGLTRDEDGHTQSPLLWGWATTPLISPASGGHHQPWRQAGMVQRQRDARRIPVCGDLVAGPGVQPYRNCCAGIICSGAERAHLRGRRRHRPHRGSPERERQARSQTTKARLFIDFATTSAA